MSISTAWPTVWPKLSVARSPVSSRSSRATTAAFWRADVATTQREQLGIEAQDVVELALDGVEQARRRR